jgi:hypothetical protein
MPYVIGVVLALLISGSARLSKIDRAHGFYPLTMAVIALIYVFFAVVGRSVHALVIESIIASLFLLLSAAGYKSSLWFIVVALAGHGVMDFFHPHLVTNPGVPKWWPAFCGAYDVVAAAWLGWLLNRSTLNSGRVSTPK